MSGILLLESLLEGVAAASASAAVLIVAALALRAVFRYRTPRRVFCLVWDVILLRLFIPAALPSPVSIERWLRRPAEALSPSSLPAAAQGTFFPGSGAAANTETAAASALAGSAGAAPSADVRAIVAAVWLVVALALAAWFVLGHLRSRLVYACSLPCGDAFVREFSARQALRRRAEVRTSDRISSPLTYGVLRPVILLPSRTDFADRATLRCVLEHEYQHIRRFDTLRKTLAAAALCLHWFNPAVLAMYAVFGRDIELACDEAATARGADRAAYARALLVMEERRGRLGLSGSHFSQNALEERVTTIMKYKKTSVAALAAVAAVMCAAATVFAAVAPEQTFNNRAGRGAPEPGSTFGRFDSVEGDVMVLSQGGEDGERLYSVDGGRSFMSEAEYRDAYGGGDLQIEWWTAEEYAAWLEEEKQALQGIIGERGYTSSEGWFTWDQRRVDEAIALYEGILEDIKNGALYSKTVTDANGDAVDEIMLGSGTLNAAEAFGALEEDAVSSPEQAADESALLTELLDFGVEEVGGRLTYGGKRVRFLVDGAFVGGDGYAVRYVYSDPDGTADIHTLRAFTRFPDGSYDPMGDLVGVAAQGDPDFDEGLIEAALAGGSSDAAAQSAADADDEQNLAALLAPYTAFGLRYEYKIDGDGTPQLRMTLDGKQVHSLFDAETGVFVANNLHGTELARDAVDLEAVYRGGALCGLRESEPPHGELHAAFAFGDGDGQGQSLAEIFARFEPYGLVYTERANGLGSLSLDGRTVAYFADLKPDGGEFSYRDPYISDGLRVYAEYGADGSLAGLRTE